MHAWQLSLIVSGQCPCSGGRAINPLILLVIVAGIWLLVYYIGSVRRKEGVSLMNKVGKIAIVAVLAIAVVIVIGVKQNKSGQGTMVPGAAAEQKVPAEYKPEQLTGKGLPALIDLGAAKCIPCKLMAPILKELKEELEGKLVVHFLDLSEYPGLAGEYGIRFMPTQVFYDASGKELFRHEGFFSKEAILGKWKELGVDLSGSGSQLPEFERLTAAKPDDRPKDTICYMCDGGINPKTLVAVQTDKGPVGLCSPHCYFIMYSCLTEDKSDFDKKVSVTDWATGKPVLATEAVFLCGQDETTARPWIRAFAHRADAVNERTANGGNILALEPLRQKEMSDRCGFCDRAVYPQDAAEVIVEGGVHTWGCCCHCALGVAARTGKNIEVHEKDRLTGQEIVVKTLNGSIVSLEPASAVAWFGQRQKPDGSWGSAGCFHQGFFVNTDNLKKWVDRNPYETGKLISISQALAGKMKLSPQQIKNACKIGECAPK